MFRTIRIRTKLAAALAVPLVGLVGIAGYEAVGAADDADTVRTQVELARASLGPGSAITTLQNERNLASLELLGLDEGVDLPVKDLAEARKETDAAIAALTSEVRRGSVELRAAFGPAIGTFGDLKAIRQQTDDFTGARDLSAYDTAASVFDQYTNVIDPLLQTAPRLATNLDDAALRNGVSLVGAAARQGEASAQIVRWVLLSQVTDNATDPDAQRKVLTWIERSAAAEAEMRLNMNGPFEVVRQGTIVTGAGSEFLEQANRFVAGAPAEVPTMLAAVDSTDSDGSQADTAANLAAAVLDREAGSILDDAQWRERAFQGLALAMVLAGAVITYYAARSITRPLRSLREQADEMARVRLPASVQEILDTPVGQDVLLPAVEPISVATRDEVAEVAEALNTVQTSALDLAVEQAVLRRNISDSFVNLGRRNQNLLNRQLDFITELERDEVEPDALEGLFRLDHLATRMRRNAESLLVLAGVEPPRQWSAPVRTSDVVRAALGEVEDYQRVVVRHLDPGSITGSAAADVAHVLAELIENALSFSPPEQPVEVRGRRSATGYTLAITDSGLGMSAEDLARANRRLAGAESFTVAPSRYLGHYVAGHLAARHGVHVELQDSPAGGITAKVDVPRTLLADAGPATGPATDVTAEHEPATPDVAEWSAPTPEPAREPEPAMAAWGAFEADVAGPARSGDDIGDVAVPAATALPTADVSTMAEPSTRLPAEAERGSFPTVAEPATGSGSQPVGVASPRGPSAPSDSVRTAGGLARRVPGAQRPDTRSLDERLNGGERRATPPAGPADADAVYGFLASYHEGVARGRADASGTDEEER